MIRSAIISAALSVAGGTASAVDNDAPIQISNPTRAEFNWLMNCQGCHGVDGQGSPGGAPPLPHVVAGFLHVEGGRNYLAQVPGVAHAPLTDGEIADVLNWMLLRFDCARIPKNFAAYSEREVAALRESVLITDAHIVRAELLAARGASQIGFEATDATRANTCLDRQH